MYLVHKYTNTRQRNVNSEEMVICASRREGEEGFRGGRRAAAGSEQAANGGRGEQAAGGAGKRRGSGGEAAGGREEGTGKGEASRVSGAWWIKRVG
jgi:hypothetical protein